MFAWKNNNNKKETPMFLIDKNQQMPLPLKFNQTLKAKFNESEWMNRLTMGQNKYKNTSKVLLGH